MTEASVPARHQTRFAFAPDEPPFTDRGLSSHRLADETTCVRALLDALRLPQDVRRRIGAEAAQRVARVRMRARQRTGLDALLREYDLSSEEGVVLMCLAEALLRIPDAQTADRLIADKLVRADWLAHAGSGRSLLVNASTWGLMLTGRIVEVGEETRQDVGGFLHRLVARLGEPLIRSVLRQAMRVLAAQFVMGRNIGEALERAAGDEHHHERFSFDMLGEAALTARDGERYFAAYTEAIAAIAAIATIGARTAGTPVFAAPGISVKLSALHPRYEFAQRRRVHRELVPRVLALAGQARDCGIALTLDAEEADRLELSLDVFEAVYRSPALAGWEGFGLAVQAYQKCALKLCEWLVDLARAGGRRIPLRLVKGAYWDTEIKRAQECGLAGYPVFTRKVSTDVSYLACAKCLLAAPDAIHPQFATHNAHTLAAVRELAGSRAEFEFQRLYGMGEDLYAEVGQPCRVYAPVGSHEDLLPYLVRRLLENGANTSFVNRLADEHTPAADLVADPVAAVAALDDPAHPRIPLPRDLFGDARRNSCGLNLWDAIEVERLGADMSAACAGDEPVALPVINGRHGGSGAVREIRNPARTGELVGRAQDAGEAELEAALDAAHRAQPGWDAVAAAERAAMLERAADRFEADRAGLMALCVREGGRTLPDAAAEVREAVDHLRYYAQQVRTGFAAPLVLPGPTGERNELSLHGRGVFLALSPWNFPLAIFTAQVAAALATGNSVLAKPAACTPLIAARAVDLLHAAGIPPEVLHFTPGPGGVVGARLIPDARLAGVVFTGSIEVAQLINRQLAARAGPIATLIAETGGQNALIADSSALPEQLVGDVVRSAFNSAGQRCSALRVLCLQEDIAERVLDLLAGHMDELAIGDPALLATDVGPLIDDAARSAVAARAAQLAARSRLIRRCTLPRDLEGHFFAPLAVEIAGIGQLGSEVFGPVLHVVRWEADALDRLVDAINATGYGLTLGVHSRIDATVQRIAQRARVGNLYVNRNQIGAVVGVQPFGGEGLSGTGPKTGGPHYLRRFATERTLTVNTAAVGGNAALLALGGD